VKKTILLVAVIVLTLAPLIGVFAADSTDPAKTEEIKTEETTNPPTSPEPNPLDSILKIGETIGKLFPIILGFLVIVMATWVFFDASRRTKYGWIWGIASLLVVPWIFYLVWRPQYTLDEMKMLEADEELRRIEHDYYQFMLSREKQICSVCGTPLSHDFKICPNCYSEVKKLCTRCGRPMELDWKVCPYCGNR
jgi:RNA polymerase subunit RPABC4/transcription elongation factor Spt4